MDKQRKPRKLKDDDEVQPITLIMRQYYNNENHKIKQAIKKDRYDNDPEYRENIKLKALLNYYRRKEKRLLNESA
jgi:hypothetical protein